MNDIMNLFSLNGKNAVVTGANTGLGQGICVALAAAGAHVFGVARRSCDETAAKIAAEGGQFTEVRADLSDFAAIDSILEQVHAHADRIDILVNNAGIIKRCDAIDVTPENWDAVDFLNEKMVFFLSQAVAKAKTTVPVTVALVESDAGLLLQRRPAKGLLAGLWQPAAWEKALTKDELTAALAKLGVQATLTEPLPPAKHVFTHRVWQLSGWRGRAEACALPDGFVWAAPEQLAEVYPVPNAFGAYMKR